MDEPDMRHGMQHRRRQLRGVDRQATAQFLQFTLHLDQLLPQVQDHFDTGKVHAKVVDQTLDEADLLDIALTIAPDIAGGALRSNKTAPLVQA
jgi:hypothetical protein